MTQSTLLNATYLLFLNAEINSLSIGYLSRKLNISRRTFYNYFHHKDDFLKALTFLFLCDLNFLSNKSIFTIIAYKNKETLPQPFAYISIELLSFYFVSRSGIPLYIFSPKDLQQEIVFFKTITLILKNIISSYEKLAI